MDSRRVYISLLSIMNKILYFVLFARSILMINDQSFKECPLMRETLENVGLVRCDRDEVVVQSDSLVQPLPRLVQGINAVPDTQTISTVLLHSSVC